MNNVLRLFGGGNRENGTTNRHHRAKRALAALVLAGALALAAGCSYQPSAGAEGEQIRVEPETFRLHMPADVALDLRGNLYISDLGQDRIYCLCPDGQMVVFASELRGPAGLAVDRDGNVLVVETEAGRIVRIAPDGTRSVVLGPADAPQ
ncbi:MAG: hypothetical protein AB7D51_09875 [Desulfovibrionaceae bacterium]